MIEVTLKDSSDYPLGTLDLSEDEALLLFKFFRDGEIWNQTFFNLKTQKPWELYSVWVDEKFDEWFEKDCVMKFFNSHGIFCTYYIFYLTKDKGDKLIADLKETGWEWEDRVNPVILTADKELEKEETK